MKNKLLKITLITIIALLAMHVYSMAAVIVSTDKQVDSGSGTVTVTVTSKQSLGAYTLSLTDTDGLTLTSASGSETISGDNKTITGASATGITTLGSYTFSVPTVSTDTEYNVKFSITGMETPDFKQIENETNTAVVTVKAKEEPKTDPTLEPVYESESEPTPTPTPAPAPNFTDADRTMYSDGEINLRSSWSTDSRATLIDKGTELHVTATSSNTVNGYVWYRVEYNGETRYVASELLKSEKPESKSNNANLKSLTIEKYDLSPKFDKETTSYTLTVPSSVEKLDVKAEAEDAKAKVDVRGNDALKEKETTVAVSVSAEDGTIKIYEIKVIKQDQVALGLKSLKIKDTDIDTKFKTDLYVYKIDIKDVNELEITAVATDEKAKVEIKGNKDLKEGENPITIIVTSEDGQKKVTYQVKANKVIGNSEDKKEEKSSGISPKVYLFGAIGLVVVAAIVVGVVIFIKRRKQKDDDIEFTDNIEEDKKNDNENTEKRPIIDYFMENKENEVINNDNIAEENKDDNGFNNDYNRNYDFNNNVNENNNYNNDYNNDDNNDDESHKRGRHF